MPLIAPLSPAQLTMWLAWKRDKLNLAYNAPQTFRLHGDLDVEALKEAVAALSRRQAAFRTRFAEIEGEPVQVVDERSSIPLSVHDLSTWSPPARADALRDLLNEGARRPFDLEQAPLARMHLLSLGQRSHVMMMVSHHIIVDLHSVQTMIAELQAVYNRIRRGEPVPDVHDDGQFAKRLSLPSPRTIDDAADDSSFWRDYLRGAPSASTFPSDRPRPPYAPYAGGDYDFPLPGDLVRSLKAIARREQVTLFTVLASAYATLLARFSGLTDVVFGIPVSVRSEPEVKLVGMNVNMLPVRVGVAGDLKAVELIAAVRRSLKAALAHKALPFDEIVETVRPARAAGRLPIFQCSLNYRPFPYDVDGWDGLKAAHHPWPTTGRAQFEVGLTFDGEGDDLVARFEYAAEMFDAETARRFADAFLSCLHKIAEEPDIAVCRIPLLSPAERRRILFDWNATDEAGAWRRCVHELFEEQVSKTPDAVAVSFEETQLTYGELNARANRLARHLRDRGVRRGARVALCVERSLAMVVGVLAVLKSGGAYVPLDPSYPLGRLRHMLGDSAPAVVLTHGPVSESVRAVLGEGPAAVVDVEADAALWSDAASGDLGHGDVSPDDLAYVMYTSGSTGEPNGVLIEHRGVANRLYWMQSSFDLRPGDPVLQKAPFTFDASVWEMFWPLVCGGKLIVARADGHKDPGYLVRLIRSAQLQNIHFVPSMLQVFLEHEGVSQCTSLRRVFSGGEQLHASLVRRLRDRLPAVEIYNCYGPTETTVTATTWRCRPGEVPENVPIGRPMANVRTYILDAHREPVPVGVIGELHIGGVQVGRGYLNRPDLTAARFAPSPFVDGDRLYKTGDLARYLPDGTIEHLGRYDFQVKIRGLRIELGEIEARLREYAGMRDVVVVAREDVPGEKRLVAYYTSAGLQRVSAEDLRAHLVAVLPEYMIPAAYVALEALPLTPNGKLDRKSLPAPDDSAYATRAYEEPRGQIERTIARIWSEVLQLEKIGRHDNFFEIGGHSLSAVRVLSHMRAAGLHSDIRTLFHSPTVRGLAENIGAATAEVAVPSNVITPESAAITPEMLPLAELSEAEIQRVVETVDGGVANVQDIYPLAPLQEGILFHHLLGRDGDPYEQRRMLRFDTRDRLDRFVAALQAVIDRHDILRTAVVWEGLREPVQVVWRRAQLVVEEVACDVAAGDVLDQLATRFDPLNYRLDLRRAPLFHVAAARDGVGDRWSMVLLYHHVVSDHMTSDALFRELRAHLDGQEAELPKPRPFRDFIAQARLGVTRAEHEAFFADMLTDVDEPTAPFGITDVHGDGSETNEVHHLLDRRLSLRLRESARALGVSTASVCHVAWARVLGALCGRDDLVFGTVLFGRMNAGEGVTAALGPAINTLPLRVRIEGSVRESVRRAHDLLGQLMRHEHASLALAQRCSAVPAPAPLFSTLLNYRHLAEIDPYELTNRAWEGIEFLRVEERSNYPLVMSVNDFGDRLGLTAHTVSPIDPKRLCGYMTHALEELVEALERAPESALSGLRILPEAERHRILVEWNATDRPHPADRCVHELFEEQVKRTPDAAAVLYEDTCVSYAELNARANRLARCLRDMGVGPDRPVALCLQRSVEVVVGLLATFKAGGVYMPLDPSYPLERLSFMLEDSAPVVVLTHAAVPDAVKALLAGRVSIDLCEDADRWKSQAESDLGRPDLTPEHLAYVIYTSGSTGQPKGVMAEHRSCVNRICAQDALTPMSDLTVFSQKTALGFADSFFEITTPLAWGKPVVIIPTAADKSPEALVAALAEKNVSNLVTVPSLAEAMDASSETLPRLRNWTLSGEAVNPALARRLSSAMQHCRLINLYGSTEVAADVLAYEIHGDETNSVPIGRPLPNTRTYILDERLEPVATGVAGELHIGGLPVARGYLNRPELTAERFIASPFVAGDRLYKTGDLARYRPDGTVEYLGRNDFQVKIRGFRIELGEIEACLRDHSGIRDVVVVAREEVPGDKRLVAYCVAVEQGAVIEVDELRAHLRRTLPDYMVPAAYVFLESLPLTPNGKVARKALPAPDELAFGRGAYEAPQGDVEQTIARIWSEVLNVEAVSRQDNFFALGGHSLSAMKVVQRLRLSGLDVDVTSLFRAPLLTELATAAVVEGTKANAVPPANGIPDDAETITPEMVSAWWS